MHGVIMMFLFAIPMLEGLALWLLPKILGARDMAFPRLNALSIWLLVCAVPPLILSLLVGGIRDGWSVYQPLNAQAGPGMIGYQTTIIVFAVSTALASVNIMTTVLTMRAKGMTWSRNRLVQPSNSTSASWHSASMPCSTLRFCS